MANEFKIEDADLEPVKDSVVVLTGGSSGIGLATAELLLQLGALVVSGDRNPPQDDTAAAKHANFMHVYCDVTSWEDQTALFAAAQTKHGRINHVFANAGITAEDEYTELKEVDGKLVEPKNTMLHINMLGQVKSVHLAVHYLRKNENGGGIVVNASVAGLSSFSLVDYTASKTGMLGLVRGLAARLQGDWFGAKAAAGTLGVSNVRINALAPSWTRTPILQETILADPNFKMQPPATVARCAVLQMADRKRHGEIVYIHDERFFEVQEGYRKALSALLPGLGNLGAQAGKSE